MASGRGTSSTTGGGKTRFSHSISLARLLRSLRISSESPTRRATSSWRDVSNSDPLSLGWVATVTYVA